MTVIVSTLSSVEGRLIFPSLFISGPQPSFSLNTVSCERSRRQSLRILLESSLLSPRLRELGLSITLPLLENKRCFVFFAKMGSRLRTSGDKEAFLADGNQ